MSIELPQPLVSGGWLRTQLDEMASGGLILVDSRWYLDGRSGRAAYEAGHLPGAQWIDLDTELAAPGGRVVGRHPLPDPEAFAAAMRRLGISCDTPVIVYDDQHGGIAARLWWMLDTVGHPVAVLDGGLAAWPGPLTAAVPSFPPGSFTARRWPEDRLASADELLRHPGVVVDARARARFTGEDTSIDARPGHVPGARNVPWASLVDPASGGLLDPVELARRFDAAGVEPGTDVIAYCGSGVTACFDLLAMRRAGIERARLYPASWSGWSTDPTRPTATGDT